MLLLARSLAFNLAFYLVTALMLLACSPLLLMPRVYASAAHRLHARIIVWLLRVLTGAKLEVRGRERLPQGAAIIAAKHQSAFDTIGLIPIFRDPAIVMKVELLKIPLYGAFCRKFGMIAIDRSKGTRALKEIVRAVGQPLAEGRDVIIFPEGTRQSPGADPDYKAGIVPLYEQLNVPVVPVALNSGLFWPRRGFLRRPGTIVVEILEPLAPGLPRVEFRRRLQDAIETAVARLVLEARDAETKF